MKDDKGTVLSLHNQKQGIMDKPIQQMVEHG